MPVTGLFRSVAAAVLLFVTLAAPIAFGQTQSINGSIRGRVTDATGAAVPQAKLDITNDETGFSRSVQTNESGYFVSPNLPLGTYTVTIQKTGFEAQRRPGIVLNAGAEAVIDGALKVGEVTTSIEVSGGAPVIEPSRVDTGRTISTREVDNLPLTSRNPYNFVIFQPGVSGHPNQELGIPRTLNTNGLLDRINYQMDGMVGTETDRYGLRLVPISDIYVREVRTVSNSFAPEFGNTAGNIYNVITNSGSNQLHGEFYYIGRPSDASARPILLASSRTATSLTFNDVAGNAGGRIIKDKLFIFGGYEHLTRGVPSPISINPSGAAQLGISPSLLATPDSIEHAQFLNIRADWIINAKQQLFVRYNYFRNEFPFNTQVGGLNARDTAADFHDRAHIAGLQLLSTFSPTMLNELRASEPYRNEAHAANPLTGPGPQIVVSSVANFGGSTNVGDRFAEKIPSLNDNFTMIKGRHTLKTGFGWQENNDNQVGDIFSQYTFPNIASYLAAKSGANPFGYSQFRTVLGVPGAAYKSYFWDWFAQDSWQVRPNLLVIYGVRYDRYQAPDGEANAPFPYTQSFRTPGKNWSPRLGLAWTLNSKTVVRASSGIFFEAPPTNLWYNTFNNDGSSRSFQSTFLPSTPGAPAFPAVFNFLAGAKPVNPSITATTPNFRNAYSINASFQITRQLTQNDALTVGYVRTGVRELEFLRNLNLINPIGVLGDGRPIFSSAINAATRLYPQFNNITFQDVGAISDYNAMVVNYLHRWSQGFEVGASYTWSHSISDAPDVNSFEQNLPIEDATNRTRDRGNSIVNRPSAFTLSTVLAPTFKLSNGLWRRLANDNQLTLLANLASGDQQNIVANAVLNGDGITGSGNVSSGSNTQASTRPLFIGRNIVRGPSIYQVDMRYTRTFFTPWERLKPKFLAEANNVFNTRNITSLNTVAVVNAQGVATLPSTFPPASTVLEGRIIQLGVRVDW